MTRAGSILSMAFLMSTVSAVGAADLDAAGAGGVYGNVHFGAKTYFDRVDSTNVWLPTLNIGGKLAYDSMESQWGWQADLDYDHLDWDWVSPDIDVDGSLYQVDTAAHLTFRNSDSSKLGVYAGYGGIGIDLNDGTDELGVFLGSLGVGVEGLAVLSDTTWVQGRIGLIDPIYVSLDDGTTSESKTDLLGDIVGGTIAGSLHHAFTANISTRAFASYSLIAVSDAPDGHLVTVGAGGNYTFDSMPLSVGLNAGYSNLSVDGASGGGFTVGSSVTYPFGGPSSGSTGKLFNSGILDFGL